MSEMTMTVSGIVPRDGKPVAYVEFKDGDKVAEGIVPACEILSCQGFTEEEQALLVVYMKDHLSEIRDTAKGIDAMRGFMKS